MPRSLCDTANINCTIQNRFCQKQMQLPLANTCDSKSAGHAAGNGQRTSNGDQKQHTKTSSASQRSWMGTQTLNVASCCDCATLCQPSLGWNDQSKLSWYTNAKGAKLDNTTDTRKPLFRNKSSCMHYLCHLETLHRDANFS